MKIQKLKYLLPVLLSVCCLSGCKKEEAKEPEDETYYEDDKEHGYYAGWNFDLKGSRLEKELQKQLFAKHKNYVLYSQVNSYFKKTTDHDSAEAIKPGSSTNQWFYTGKEASGTGTREHVWPCAKSASMWVHEEGAGIHYVDASYYLGGGSDLYHIRTCDTTVNTARGDSYYVDLDDPEFDTKTQRTTIGESKGKYKLTIADYTTSSAGTPQYAHYAEPANQMKGDVARIILYVYIHYGDRGVAPSGNYEYTVGKKSYSIPYKDFCGSLSLTNIIGYNSMERIAEKLMEWNEMDPPSTVEKTRNDTVQKIQGNRNPFVDFPELVDQMFAQYKK